MTKAEFSKKVSIISTMRIILTLIAVVLGVLVYIATGNKVLKPYLIHLIISFVSVIVFLKIHFKYKINLLYDHYLIHGLKFSYPLIYTYHPLKFKFVFDLPFELSKEDTDEFFELFSDKFHNILFTVNNLILHLDSIYVDKSTVDSKSYNKEFYDLIMCVEEVFYETIELFLIYKSHLFSNFTGKQRDILFESSFIEINIIDKPYLNIDKIEEVIATLPYKGYSYYVSVD